MKHAHQGYRRTTAASERCIRHVRTVLFSLLIGFHNAWEQDERGMEELAMRFRAEYREPVGHPLDHPERCFFWGESSLLN